MNKAITENDIKPLGLLNTHPLLRHRVEPLMSLVEDSDEIIEKADAAEQRVIEEVRKIGHAALSEWADCKNKRQARHCVLSESWDASLSQNPATTQRIVSLGTSCVRLNSAQKLLR